MGISLATLGGTMTQSITTGNILARSFRIFGQAPGLFFSIILILYSPLLLLFLPMVLDATAPAEPGPESLSGPLDQAGLALWGPMAAGMLLFLLIAPAATAAIAYGVVRKMRGEPVTLGECFRKGFRRWVSVVAASILMGLAAFLGFVACIVPGLVVMAGLFVAIPALVVEEESASMALSRSWDLTRGHRLSTFGVIFIFIVLQQLTEVPAYVTEDLGVAQEGVGAFLLLVLTTGLSLVFTAVQSVSSAVAYHDLRVEKEGFGLEEIAAAFD